MSAEAQLREALARFAAKVVALDGGTVTLVSVDGQRATVALEGACTGCPVRGVTRDEVLAPVVRSVLGPDATVELA